MTFFRLEYVLYVDRTGRMVLLFLALNLYFTLHLTLFWRGIKGKKDSFAIIGWLREDICNGTA